MAHFADARRVPSGGRCAPDEGFQIRVTAQAGPRRDFFAA